MNTDSEQHVTAGEEFVKKLRPAGCALFLLLSAAALIICFTAKGTAVAGYSAPMDSEYYALHPEELLNEVRDNLLPLIGESAEAELADGKVIVTVNDEETLVKVRSGIIHYYDTELFDFVIEE